jgi:putative FmdB family regulatory protein
MPIYEYVCTTCGTEFEVMQKFSDKPLKKCTCSSEARVARKLSVPAFHLQGGGWYAEGYSAKKNGNGKGEAKPEAKGGDSAGTSAAAGETKTEKKEAKPAEKKPSAAPASA